MLFEKEFYFFLYNLDAFSVFLDLLPWLEPPAQGRIEVLRAHPHLVLDLRGKLSASLH